ncbi:MAG: cysteine desulfurase [Clostridiales bacterium]|jgi:cysteine desulfurase|nr:cysteine desulfurase [Clostridiales bacterium]
MVILLYNKVLNYSYGGFWSLELVYLDNAATTKVCPEAAKKALEMMTEYYGNPSSLHSLGVQAEQMVGVARRQVAKLMGCDPENLVFTSGGTEANNLAIFGAVEARRRDGKHIVTTAVEHSSVAASCKELERRGYEVTRLVPDSDGTITPGQVAEACREDTVLVTMMYVNNENGARFPIDRIISAVRRAAPRALIHCDAVQAVGKLPLSAVKMDIDLMTASAHKIHGPKGCGVLYIKKGVRILPRLFGGEHEGGMRAGTEAVSLIAAFGAAADAVPHLDRQQSLYLSLRKRLSDGLADIKDVVWLSPETAVPYIVNISVPGIKSETMLHFLAQRGVYVSSGSACSKGKRSPVLTALGLPERVIDSALRISFTHTNTPDDVDRFLEALKEGASTLMRR